jgi:spermidine synthase
MPTLALSVILFLSGAAGLAYEVVWLRLLSNTLGASQVATTTVLVVFMVGLAAGSAWIARSIDRRRRPLRIYALLELAIGGCALLMPVGLSLVEALDRSLGAGGDGAAALMRRAAAAAVVLLAPTIVMGATLPAIGAFMRRRAPPGRAFTIAYAAQLAGAAGGTLLASFWLIPRLGLDGSSRVGALANFAAAALAWRLGGEPDRAAATAAAGPDRAGVAVGTLDADVSADSRGEGERASPRLLARLALVDVFLSGLLLLGSEVLFTRVLVLSATAKVHSFALMLFVFLLGLALASAIVARLPDRAAAHPATPFAILLIGAAGLLVSCRVALTLPLPLLLATQRDGAIEPAAYLRLVLLLSAAIMLPTVATLGMVLPLSLRRAALAGGGAVGRVLCVNTVGSVLGPLIVPWAILPSCGILGSLGLLAVVALGGAVLHLPSFTPRARLVAVAAAIAAGAVVWSAAPPFAGTPRLDATLYADAEVRKAAAPAILRHVEGPTATVTVADRGRGERSLRLDGFEAAAAPVAGVNHYQYMRIMAHLPALLHRGPVRRGLVICCGTGTTAGTLMLHVKEGATDGVDLVDLHDEVLSCLTFFSGVNHDLARDRRCAKIADDGRAWLRRTNERYDVVTLEPMPPQYAGMTQLYSVEFDRAAAAVLGDGGVLCQWLPWHLMEPAQALAITKAMASVLPHVQVWEHDRTGVLIGSREPLELDAARLAELSKSAAIAADLAAAELTTPAAWCDAFLCDANDLGDALKGVAPIVDDRPALEYDSFNYGLTLTTPEQQAFVREPFFRARVEAKLPLHGFAPADEERLRRDWRVLSIRRYGGFLHQSRGAEAARRFVLERTAGEPALRESPLLRELLATGAPPK